MDLLRQAPRLTVPRPTLSLSFVPSHAVAALLLGLCILTLVGCGDGKIARHPVEGKVLVNGKPVEDAMVVFCPVGGSDELQKVRPAGKTDANGNFVLTTFEKEDGAPAGEYQVMIRWEGNSGPRAPGKQYANPKKSGLTATVKSEKTTLDPFELSVEKSNRRRR